MTSEGIITDQKLCIMCGECSTICPTNALQMSGKAMSVPEIMNEIEKERIFFDQSGGGVTFSGGEPLIHSKILMELLDECGKRGFHRAVDTAGNVNTNVILEVAKRTDLFLYDLKMMDTQLHKKWTHSGNEKILHNLKAIAEAGAEIIIRIPLIDGINVSSENIEKTASFIAELAGNKKEVHLLPYHSIAQNKFIKLSKPENFEKFREPGKNTLFSIVSIFTQYGIVASIGG